LVQACGELWPQGPERHRAQEPRADRSDSPATAESRHPAGRHGVVRKQAHQRINAARIELARAASAAKRNLRATWPHLEDTLDSGVLWMPALVRSEGRLQRRRDFRP